MTEVNEPTTSAEIIDFNELLQTIMASTSSRNSDDKMSVLLLQHLNIISAQLQAEEVVRKVVELEEDQKKARSSLRG